MLIGAELYWSFEPKTPRPPGRLRVALTWIGRGHIQGRLETEGMALRPIPRPALDRLWFEVFSFMTVQ